jgi:hypothetical protein|tara:strand:- start:211 stop:834 length:624 start_codon:yes stop_codon:yes gene_type:complete
MSVLRSQKTMSAVMAILFVSMSMPGCLSLVIGREMMESARGFPEVREMSTPFDLSHTFVIDGTEVIPTQVQKTITEQISIDHTVQEIIINFQTSVNYYAGESDQRYVHVELLWCDDSGANCDTSDPIYEVLADNGSYPQTRTELNCNLDSCDSGLWRLTVDGRGMGTDTGLGLLDFQDSWVLRVTVIRPCLAFPESPEECTPTVDFE